MGARSIIVHAVGAWLSLSLAEELAASLVPKLWGQR